MAWYNAGNWIGLDGTNIPYALVDLCNAINERRDCLGRARVAWVVNTGTESSPTIGTKTANLDATDLFGLDMFRQVNLNEIYSQMAGLLSPNSTAISAAKYSGWAKTSTNTGLASNGDLWTLADIATDSGVPVPVSITSVFDLGAANFIREALDRMLYPVIYPRRGSNSDTQEYGTNTGGAANPFASAEDAWAGQLTVSSQPSLPSEDCAGRITENGSGEWTAISRHYTEFPLSCLFNESGSGYLGTVTKAWGTIDSDGESPGIDGECLDGTFTADIDGLIDFEYTTHVPIDGSITAVCGFADTPPLSTMPFAAVSGTTAYASLSCKFTTSGGTSTFQHTRQIIDVSAYLTDQA